MDIVKKLNIMKNAVMAFWLLLALIVVGYLLGMVGFGAMFYKFPTENYIGLFVTLTVAGMIKDFVQEKIKFGVITGQRLSMSDKLMKAGFNGVYYSIGLWAVAFLAGFVGFKQYLLDFNIAANFVPIVLTLAVAGFLAIEAKDRLKL